MESHAAARPEPRRRRRRYRARLFVSFVVFTFLLVLMEGGFRIAGPRLGMDCDAIAKLRRFAEAGQAGAYVPRAYYGFSRDKANASGNCWGFNGDDWNVERETDVLRIACIGGSTTEGGNRGGYRGSYPFFLGRQLKAGFGREVEVMNCGISLWTSNESVAAWFVLIKDFRPDLVIYHHAANDVEPRNFPGFRPDYIHYRKVWEHPRYGVLERALIRWSDLYSWYVIEHRMPTLRCVTGHDSTGPLVFAARGELEAETARSYTRNILSIAADVRSWGGELMLMSMPYLPGYAGEEHRGALAYRYGITEHNQIMRDLAEEHGFLLADVAARFEEQVELTTPFFEDFVHVSPEGNKAKAFVVTNALRESWAPLATTLAASADVESGD